MNKLFAIAEELRELDVKASRLAWAKYTTGYDFGIMDVEREMQEKMKSKESWNTIQDLLAADLSSLDLRRVQIMEMTFRPFHLSARLNELSLAIQEKTNELSSILNTQIPFRRCVLKEEGIELERTAAVRTVGEETRILECRIGQVETR